MLLTLILLITTACEKDSPTYFDMRELIYGGESYAGDIPPYEGEIYTVLNDNIPYFTVKNLAYKSYEFYSPLDSFGRVGVCFSVIGKDLMPDDEREGIGMIKPSGWHTVRYDDIIEGKYLYNRCHLIGFQLTGENANEKNLMTGTRYFNVEGMLPFENMVASYVRKTDNHVFYRVTPVFEKSDLVAKGVILEALSVEDNGEGISLNVFIHNIQPGVHIDYSTGESRLIKE
ncbi:MAG: DNA/RNA non-specific endonuclease [Eubacteriaceae bacterium]|nr:DNA/RNA non-specific endonuclease [Eubacteriaceae bacterium]